MQTQQPLYHVVLGDRKLGPYDRRTIVGMRIKNALANDDRLLTGQGVALTVEDLVRQRPGESFASLRTGSYSLVQATFTASLLEVSGAAGHDIPAFRGEVEARMQGDVLRIAGRFRERMRWREDRVKLPLAQVVHARVRGSIVDLWLRPPGAQGLQRLTLELFSPESAGEFVDHLPGATPWPEPDSQPAALQPQRGGHRMLWVAVGATVVVVALVLMVVLMRRVV